MGILTAEHLCQQKKTGRGTFKSYILICSSKFLGFSPPILWISGQRGSRPRLLRVNLGDLEALAEPVSFSSFFLFMNKYLEEDDGTSSKYCIIRCWWAERIFWRQEARERQKLHMKCFRTYFPHHLCWVGSYNDCRSSPKWDQSRHSAKSLIKNYRTSGEYFNLLSQRG